MSPAPTSGGGGPSYFEHTFFAADFTLNGGFEKVADASAPGGFYIHPTEYGATATVELTLYWEYDFTFKASVWALNSSRNSMNFTVNSDPRQEWKWLVPFEEWRHGQMLTYEPNKDWIQKRLAGGAHTFKLTCRERWSRLAKLVVMAEPVPGGVI